MSQEINDEKKGRVSGLKRTEERSTKKSSNSRRGKIFKHRKDSFQEVAKKRIEYLFFQAEQVFAEDEKLAKRYVFLARNISTKYKVPFSKVQKIRSCKVCGAFLKQGINARIRLSKGNVVIKCFSCNSIRRFKHK